MEERRLLHAAAQPLLHRGEHIRPRRSRRDAIDANAISTKFRGELSGCTDECRLARDILHLRRFAVKCGNRANIDNRPCLLANHELCHALRQLHGTKEIHGKNALHLRRIRHQKQPILRHNTRIIHENIDRLLFYANLLRPRLDAILICKVENHRLNPYTVLLRQSRAHLQEVRFCAARTRPYICALCGKLRENGGSDSAVRTCDNRISAC